VKKNFWQKLKKPIFCLAPMADVTDQAFRLIITKYSKYGGKFTRLNFAKKNLGGPDIIWTEFTSADGLCSKEGRQALKINLMFSPKERPIVAQLFGANPEKMREASAFVRKLGFDGIDINMGCPDRKVEKSGAGAALIKNPDLAREIIRSAIEGGKGLPVSVKTRIGYNKDELETWLPAILSEKVSAVTIHARTRKEMSEVPAHWDRVKRAVEIRDFLKSDALIIGNGDLKDLKDGEEKIKETGADGVMFGRAIFGNPWLFNKKSKPKTSKEKLLVMTEHAKLFQKLFNGRKNFAIMKKHFKAYCNGFDGAKELRIKLMETQNAKEVEEIVREYIKKTKKSLF
jgi:nifR3 family TIM-barrel protein